MKQSMTKADSGRTLNHGEMLLKQRMYKVNNLKMRKNNGQLKIRLENMTNNIESKRQYIMKINNELVVMNTNKPKEVHRVSGNVSQDQVEQLERLVTRGQEQSITELNKWFMINKTRSRDIPYTICFQPIISTRTSVKLPANVVRDSIYKIFQYLTTRATLQSLTLPYPTMRIPTERPTTNDENTVSEYTMQELIQLGDTYITEHIPMWLTRATLNIVYMCRHNGILPQPHIPIDIPYLVDQIDVDGLLYGLYTGHIPNSNKYIHSDPHMSTHNRFQDILGTIEQLLDNSNNHGP